MSRPAAHSVRSSLRIHGVAAAVALVIALLLVACQAPAAAPTAAPKAAAPAPTAAPGAAPTAAPKASGPVRTLRLAHAFNEQSAYHQGALDLAKSVEKASNGQMKIEIFPNGQLGDDQSMMQALKLGTLDLTTLGTATLAGLQPLLQVADLPFMFKDRNQVDKVFDGPIGQDLAKLFEGKGLHPLSYWEIGFRHVTNSRAPIKTPDDVKGLKLRTLNNPVQIQAWTLIGAQPTPMDFSEVYNALQQHVVDAQENPLNVIGTQKFYEVQKYVSLTSHQYTSSPLLVSDLTWNKLSAEEKKILSDAAMASAKVQRQAAADQDAQWLKQLQDHGMQVEQNPDRDAFAKKATPVWDEYAKKYGADGARLLELLRSSR